MYISGLILKKCLFLLGENIAFEISRPLGMAFFFVLFEGHGTYQLVEQQAKKVELVAGTVDMNQNSKLQAPFVYYSEPDQTCLWAVWKEQHAQHT